MGCSYWVYDYLTFLDHTIYEFEAIDCEFVMDFIDMKYFSSEYDSISN